jgi:hypothetical protein
MIEKSVELHTLMRVDVIKGFIGDVDNRILEEIILKYGDQKMSFDVADTAYEDSFCPETVETSYIVSQIKECFENVYPNSTLELETQWSHIHKKNMSTNTHSHCLDGISAVYYVKVDDKSGKICFEYRPYLEMTITDRCFDPMEGMFLIFPGYLLHRVTRNLSDSDRISLSFNFNVKSK